MFKGKSLLCSLKLCVSQKSAVDILHMVHDSKLWGYFKFANTMARLGHFHWRHKARNVKNYVDGCIVCQQYKDSNQKKITDHISLEIPARRWGSLTTDFMAHFSTTKDRFDAIATWEDWLTRRFLFVKSMTTDTVVHVADSFFSDIFKHHRLPHNIVSDRDPKFTSEF